MIEVHTYCRSLGKEIFVFHGFCLARTSEDVSKNNMIKYCTVFIQIIKSSSVGVESAHRQSYTKVQQRGD